MQEIIIRGMEFYAYHGCFEEEQQIGTRFKIDIHFQLDFSKTAQTDDLQYTLNYLEVYQSLKKIVECPVKTLERLGYQILEALFREYPIIDKATIYVSKMNPPLGGKIENVTVVQSKER